MESIAKVKRHENLCQKLNDIYRKKNHDYGDSFHKSIVMWGIKSAGVRISDKYNRFVELMTSDDQMVEDESIKDTLLDMANYCLMTLMELEELEGD